jgi:hypothetical protein
VTATVAAVLGSLGAFGGAIVNVLVGVNLATAASAHMTHDAAAQFLVTSFNSASSQAFTYLYFLTEYTAPVLMGIALWRSRNVPRWLTALFTVGLEIAEAQSARYSNRHRHTAAEGRHVINVIADAPANSAQRRTSSRNTPLGCIQPRPALQLRKRCGISVATALDIALPALKGGRDLGPLPRPAPPIPGGPGSAPGVDPGLPRGRRARICARVAASLTCRRRHRKRRNVPMSHHLDTPLAAQTGQLYIDDLYVFPGEDSTVFIMDVNSNVNGLHSEPGFHPEARYEFKVHFDGADFETLTYRVSFGEADSDGRQPLRLHALTGDQARGDDAAGHLVLEGQTGETASTGGTRLWAGRIADSFYIDLSLLGIIDEAVAKGTAPNLSGWRPEGAKNTFAGTFVESIVLEVSHEHPQLRPGARAGVWCATKLATDAGGWRQVNRGGHPMMWPIFWPTDTDFSDPANTRHPSEDVNATATSIGDQVAAVVAAAGTSDDPRGYGKAVAGELFPDVLSYVVGTPAAYGFASRNGRTLADNAPEVMLSLVTNMAVPSGLKPAVASQLRDSNFPYVVPA